MSSVEGFEGEEPRSIMDRGYGYAQLACRRHDLGSRSSRRPCPHDGGPLIPAVLASDRGGELAGFEQIRTLDEDEKAVELFSAVRAETHVSVQVLAPQKVFPRRRATPESGWLPRSCRVTSA